MAKADPPTEPPTFLITTTCRATIRERWKVTAPNETEARALLESDADMNPVEQVADDETVGDEEDREIESIVPFDQAQLPPSMQSVMKDAQHFAERVILAELAVRLFRTLVLGNFVHADTPAAMNWLKDWIDGTMEGHGPMGRGPMIWPDRLPFVAGLLRQWGFMPTPTQPPYVMRKPMGPMISVVEQGKPS